MAQAFYEHVDILELDERHGAVVAMKLLARVSRLATNNYQVMYEALDALGIPPYGNVVDNTKGGMLTLVGRSVHLVDKDKGTADVTLSFEHLLKGPNQKIGLILAAPPVATGLPPLNINAYFVKWKTKLTQKKTNLEIDPTLGFGGFFNDGTPRGHRTVVLSYRYPPGGPLGNELVRQGTDQLSVFYPHSHFRIQGFIDVGHLVGPHVVVQAFQARVNENGWRAVGDPTFEDIDDDDLLYNFMPRHWMCTDVEFECAAVVSPSNPACARYLFTFEFTENTDGWDPVVVFIDPKTNRPPADLVPGLGTHTSLQYPRRDFSKDFISIY